jgi:hypothetical protein
MGQPGTVLKEDLDEFVKRWQAVVDKYHKDMEYNWKTTVSSTVGKKYARIVWEDHGQRSAAGFVDLSSGDILKAASWRAPAKHARGNIFDESQGMDAIDRPGFVKYLK